jgi:hypothetical protein
VRHHACVEASDARSLALLTARRQGFACSPSTADVGDEYVCRCRSAQQIDLAERKS